MKPYIKVATIQDAINLSNDLSLGFGSDYNYNKGDFQVKGNWGSSAEGHSDNLGVYSNLGYSEFWYST